MNRLKRHIGSNSRLAAAVDYSVRLPGKRIRPMLVLECARVSGGVEPDAWAAALDGGAARTLAARQAAIAVELVHTFTLIHDDLPAMDDDDLRRGQPTNHRVFGEANAILAGDWLLAHALGLVASDGENGARMATVLAGAVADVVAGQAADMACEAEPPGVELVRYIHANKTARLLEAACRMGAIAGAASHAGEQRLASFGRCVGLAFQIADDLLDRGGSADRMGKRVRKDASVAKQTYPAAVGEPESRREAERQIDAALAELAAFGPEAGALRGLARYVIGRDH